MCIRYVSRWHSGDSRQGLYPPDLDRGDLFNAKVAESESRMTQGAYCLATPSVRRIERHQGIILSMLSIWYAHRWLVQRQERNYAKCGDVFNWLDPAMLNPVTI